MGVYFIIAMSTTSFQLGLEYFNEKDRLEEAVSKVAETFEPIFSQAVWNLDDEQMESSVGGVMLNEYILGVKFFDDQGDVLAQNGLIRDENGLVVEFKDGNKKAATQFSKGRFRQLLSYQYEVAFDSQYRGRVTVGTLVLFSSSDVVLDHAAYTFFITFINAAVKTIFLWLIAFIVINRIVANPLTRLTGAMNDLAPDSRDLNEENSKLVNSTIASSSDELGILVRAFITMKKALVMRNKEVMDYQVHLEDKVDERTAELERASRAKSEFLANMSHEIRTPMNGVLGMVELLQDTELNKKQKQYVNTVQSSGNALLSVINDVLDFSKIEAGKMSLEKVDFDLEALIDECALIFAFKASELKLNFIAAVEQGAPVSICGDPTRMRQIVMNLLGNAFKFTEQGEVSLRVACIDQRSSDHMLYRFSISDTGIGLDEQEREQLFTSFTQADSSTTRKYGGTGLGLAISKQLVELMGGEIGVNSNKGEGSTFWFTICVEKSSKDMCVPVEGDIEVLNGCRVLLVDDHAAFNEVMTSRLSSWGMNVSVVMSGALALSAIVAAHSDNNPFDCVLLDYLMPEMDGIELARCIRDLDYDPPIKQILISAARRLLTKADFEGTDIVCAIEKPVTRRILRAELIELFGGEISVNPILKKDEENIDYSQMNVLVAEDNLVNQMVVLGMLRKLGITPVVANDGLEAVDCYLNNATPFDLILMDVEMPKMDGWEATRQIKAQSRKRLNGEEAYVVALSAHAMVDKREYAGDIGMDDYLAKPVKSDDLKRTFDKFRF